MDWHDYLIRRNTRIPKKEIEEQKYNYQCNTCLRWKKVNDMGTPCNRVCNVKEVAKIFIF